MYVLKITLVSVSMVGSGFRKLNIKVFSLGLGCCSPTYTITKYFILLVTTCCSVNNAGVMKVADRACRLHSFYLTELYR